MTKVNIPANVQQRLFDKTDQSTPHWSYPGTGKVKIDGEWFRVRQLWWAIMKTPGEFPERMDSTCKVKDCCNPDHWFDSSAGRKPPSPVEDEVKYHSRHKFYYVANTLTGGKQIRLSKDKAEAIEIWREGRDQLQAGRDWHPDARKGSKSMTVAALCTAKRMELSKRAKLGQVTPEHRDQLCGVLDRMVGHFGRRTLVANLKPSTFTEVSNSVMVDRRTGKLRSWKGYKSEVGKIRHVFTWAKKEDLIRDEPRYGNNFPISEVAYNTMANRNRREGDGLQPKAERPATFTAAEVRAMLDVAPTDIRAWIYLGLNLALENKEISLIRGSDIKQDPRGDWWFGEPRNKNAGKRLAHMWDETIDAVLEAKDVRPTPAHERYSQRVFLAESGRPIRSNNGSNVTFCKRFREVMKDADCYIERRGFRALRHTFRTYANACNDLEAVEWVMGHKNFGKDFSPESPTYVESVARARLKKVSLTLREWLFNEDGTEHESEFVQTLEF